MIHKNQVINNVILDLLCNFLEVATSFLTCKVKVRIKSFADRKITYIISGGVLDVHSLHHNFNFLISVTAHTKESGSIMIR